MQHPAATPVSPRRLAPTTRLRHCLLLLLSLLLLVPACGGESPAPEVADVPAEPAVDLTSVQTPEEEPEELEDPVPQAPPPAATSLPTNAPALDAATREAALKTLQPIQGLLKDLLALYSSAMEAERNGDDAGRRTALGEAVTLGYGVQERWNEVIAAMPSNQDFDEEQTAALHFPADHSAVMDTLDALRNIERQLRR